MISSDYVRKGEKIGSKRGICKLYLDGTMQMWIDAEDSLEVW